MIDRVLETVLYARDLESVIPFYQRFLQLDFFSHDENRFAFFKCRHSTVLIFNPEKTMTQKAKIKGSPIPPHGAIGDGHVAFAIAPASIEYWTQRCEEFGIAIESNVQWPSLGHSIYVRDPAGNSVELATPQLWGLPGSTAASDEIT